MIDLLKVFKSITAADAKLVFKALGELSTNEVRNIDDLRRHLPKKTVDAMVKRANFETDSHR